MKKISTLTCLLLTFFLVKGQEEAQKAFSAGVKLLKETNYVEAEIKFL